MKRATLCLCGTLSVLCVSVLAQVRTQQPEVTQARVPADVRFIAAGIANSRLQRLQCASAVVHYKHETPQEYIDRMATALANLGIKSIPQKTDLKANWYLDNSRFGMEVVNDPSIKDAWELQRITADEKEVRYVQTNREIVDEKPGKYYIASITPPGSGFQNGLWTAWNILDPRQYAYCFGKWPLDELLVNPKMQATYKGEVVLDGARCLQVEVKLAENQRATFWVDAEHGFLIRRIEGYSLKADKSILEYETQVTEITESNGQWLPAKLETRSYLDLPKGSSPNAKRLFTTLRIEISNFNTACGINEEKFKLNWPVGANIADGINQTKLLVVPMERKSLDVINKQRTLQKKEGLTAIPISNEQKQLLAEENESKGLAKWVDPIAIAVDLRELDAVLKLGGVTSPGLLPAVDQPRVQPGAP